jgi:A/G-specific adenine glycosylase
LTIARAETVAIIRRDGGIYCEQVPAGKAWHGLWRFPDFDPARMQRGEPLGKLKYGITKYAVTMEAVFATWKDDDTFDSRLRESSRAGVYLTAPEMQALAFAAPHRKLAARHLDITP